MPRKTKPKTQEQLDRATDQRLLKTYGISLEEYEALLKAGNGGCWICGCSPGTRRLHVDHDHSWKKVKIDSYKKSDYRSWFAQARYVNLTWYGYGHTKSAALRDLKNHLRRASVRGLLCYRHNTGLIKFSDNPDYLESAARYLDKFQEGRVLGILGR